jgi:hypothetical protein
MDMSQISIDYKSVLADLMARRAKLDAAIAAIEEVLGQGGSTSADIAPSPNRITVGVSREYRGMTIAQATLKFLRSKGEPQLTGDIARALRSGGIGSTSRNMYRTVYNTLNNRMDRHQDITKEGPKWGLAEWRQQ